MRDELIDALARATTDGEYHAVGGAWRGEEAVKAIEAFMRKHDPPLKMMAAPKDWIYPADVWWKAAPLTPWSDHA